MLIGNKIKQQPQSVIILDEFLQNSPFFDTVELFFAEVQGLSTERCLVLFSYFLFVVSNIFYATLESLEKHLALFVLFIFCHQNLLSFFFFLVRGLLLCNFLFQFLDLVKSPYQIFFEILLNWVRDHLDSVPSVVDLTGVELILDKASKLLVVILAVLGIARSLSFVIWSFEPRLIFEKFPGHVSSLAFRLATLCWSCLISLLRLLGRPHDILLRFLLGYNILLIDQVLATWRVLQLDMHLAVMTIAIYLRVVTTVIQLLEIWLLGGLNVTVVHVCSDAGGHNRIIEVMRLLKWVDSTHIIEINPSTVRIWPHNLLSGRDIRSCILLHQGPMKARHIIYSIAFFHLRWNKRLILVINILLFNT